MQFVTCLLLDWTRSAWHTLIGLVWLIIAIYIIVQVWGSRTTVLAKLIWTVVLLVAPVIGAIAWLLVGPRRT